MINIKDLVHKHFPYEHISNQTYQSNVRFLPLLVSYRMFEVYNWTSESTPMIFYEFGQKRPMRTYNRCCFSLKYKGTMSLCCVELRVILFPPALTLFHPDLDRIYLRLNISWNWNPIATTFIFGCRVI